MKNESNVNVQNKHTLLYFALTFLSLVLTLLYGLKRPYMFDDSVYALQAEEISLGANPYQYFDNKLPATQWLFSLWLNFFGHEWHSARVFSWLLLIFVSMITAFIYPRKSSQESQIFLTGFFSFWLFWLCGGSILLTDMGLALCAAITFVILNRHFLSPYHQLAAGVCLGTCLFFKQTGIVYVFSVAVVTLWQLWQQKKAWKDWILTFGAYAIGLITTVIILWQGVEAAGWGEGAWNYAVARVFDYPRDITFSSVTLFLARTAWFLIPCCWILIQSVIRKEYLRETPLFQVAGLVVLLKLLLLNKRFSAQHLIGYVPAMIFVFAHIASRIHQPWLHVTKRKLIYSGVIFLISFMGAVFIKIDTYVKVAYSKLPHSKSMVDELAKYMSSPQDRAIYFSGGIHGLRNTAFYYYTGFRPPENWPLIYSVYVPRTIINAVYAQAPKALLDPHTKIVCISSDHEGTIYSEENAEIDNRITPILKTHFERMGQTDIWIKRGVSKSESIKIYKGPYKNV